MNAPSNRADRLIKIVRDWADIYEGICKASQDREITAADFDPIAELIATDVFHRTGVFKDEADWPLCQDKFPHLCTEDLVYIAHLTLPHYLV